MRYWAFKNKEVKKAFDGYSDAIRDKLMLIRELIFQAAMTYDEIAGTEEPLKEAFFEDSPHP